MLKATAKRIFPGGQGLLEARAAMATVFTIYMWRGVVYLQTRPRGGPPRARRLAHFEQWYGPI